MAVQTFGVVLRDLLIERERVTAMGSPNWSQFALDVGLGYETLRKAVTGEREPAPKLMEAVAKALGVEPDVFAEYRLWQARRSLDPKEVGWDEAIRNLQERTQLEKAD